MDPLAPDGEEARQWLQQELRGAEYRHETLLDFLLRKLGSWLGSLFDATSGAGLGSTLISLIILASLAGLLTFVASRFRRSGRTRKAKSTLGVDADLSGRDYLAAAQLAYQQGDFDAAVVHGMRAAAQLETESGILGSSVGLTAQEVASRVAARQPNRGADFRTAAAIFDRVRYGDLPAQREDADVVLALSSVASR